MYRILASIAGWVLIVSSSVKAETTVMPPAFLIHRPDPEKIKKTAMTDEWLKLVHYKKKITGVYESQIDEKKFFLSHEGKHSPEKELSATIDLFLKNEIPDAAHGYCRFPARYKFVKKHFNIPDTTSKCTELEIYLNRLKSEAVSVVFTSYFMNSPGSIFGHTFIKLQNNKSELLDYGVNFAIDIGSDNFFKYLAGGLSGFYEGKYSVVPFYDKVREYNDFENRDLWVYHLNLTPDEQDTLIKHLWELMQSHYDYYFLSENCSYHILSAIESAAPQYNLTDNTNPLVIPVDTIKILMSYKGLVKKTEYRPSLRSVFLKSYGTLNSDEKKKFRYIIEKKIVSDKELEYLDSNTLFAIVDYYNYQYPTFRLYLYQNNEDSSMFVFKRKLNVELSRRTRDYKKNEESADMSNAPPHLIHGSERISISAGKNSRSNGYYLQPEFRLAYHDLNDTGKGYPLNSEIEFIKFSANIYSPIGSEKQIFSLQEAVFLKISAYNDFSFYQTTPSWSLYLGAERFYDSRSKSEKGTFAPGITAGIGLSKLISKNYFLESYPSLLIFGLIKFNAAYSTGFYDTSFSPGIGPAAGIKLALYEKLNIISQLEYIRYLHGKYDAKAKVTLRFQIIRDLCIDIELLKAIRFDDYKIGIKKYF